MFLYVESLSNLAVFYVVVQVDRFEFLLRRGPSEKGRVQGCGLASARSRRSLDI
jgi:hypothetical protein